MTSRSHNAALSLAAPVAPQEALRTKLRTLIQQNIEREFTQRVGVEKSARSATRTGMRNGFRMLRLTTRLRIVELRIPRDRAGEFQPTCSRGMSAVNRRSSSHWPRCTSKACRRAPSVPWSKRTVERASPRRPPPRSRRRSIRAAPRGQNARCTPNVSIADQHGRALGDRN